MAQNADLVWVQLATRIPKALHRELKLHCVNHEQSVMGFVTEAIGEKLAIRSVPVEKGGMPGCCGSWSP
jgi:hypothetical protein